MASMTPMMMQYLSIKENYNDCILFFRLGDFYEMFFDDAQKASQELELVLTGRDCGQEERAPMCGIPYHSCEAYIARLVQKGYKVAICEQVEDPADAKGIVKREVVRVVTPGTIIESSMLDETKNNYLGVVYLNQKKDGKTIADAGICFADCSTGALHLVYIGGNDIMLRVCNEIVRFAPSELLLNDVAASQEDLARTIKTRLTTIPETASDERFDYDNSTKRILGHFRRPDLESLNLENQFSAVRALGCALEYLYTTQMSGLERITELDVYSDTQFMRLDMSAQRNLELTATMRSGEKRGSLLWVLDHTNTAMGKRMIRSYIEQPLISVPTILRRQNAVEEMVNASMTCKEIKANLKEVHDLERLMTRVIYGNAGGKELRMLYQAVCSIAPIIPLMSDVASSLFKELRDGIDPLDDIRELIDSAIVDDPPFSVREGGMIRPGYSEEVDRLRSIMTDGKDVIARIEAQEKARTGIKTLKVGYNRVFGYYIEISKSFVGEVPDTYIRKQTLANAERYITQELKELENQILTAKDTLQELEYNLFNKIRMTISAELHRIQDTARAVAHIDALCSLADVARHNGYTRPIVDLSDSVHIIGGRHPVVEMLQDSPFVPNDTLLDTGDDRVCIITGPNMAGKSTFMRQTALIVLMAQIGSFVPADRATVGVVDSIFTRVGASDDLAAGQSTFMVEMSEVASILSGATAKSLIIFDEIGRGTSTFDGMSIARSVLEFVAEKLGCKALFATHYHELTVMEQEIKGIKNYNVAVKKRGDEITFLRRIVRGAADDSYGIEVAKLAGVPDIVVRRAREILVKVESDGIASLPGTPPPAPPDEANGQMPLIPAANSEVMNKLKKLDINTLTPIEAMQILHELNREAQTY